MTEQRGTGAGAAMGAAVAVGAIFVGALAIPLAVARQLELTSGELTSWIGAVYGIPGLLSIVLVARWRKPVLLTGNIFLLLFLASLGAQRSWSELVGATILAGVVVLALGALGATDTLARWIPPPIVFALLAGAVLPFVIDVFTTALGGDVRGHPVAPGEQWAAWAAIAAWLAARRWLHRWPAVLPALVAAVVTAAAAGEVTFAGAGLDFALPVVTAPSFDLAAIASTTPIIVVLVALQANVPSLVLLRSLDYDLDERVVAGVSGAGTALGSLFGPVGVSLSLPATALTAGSSAGPFAGRHRAATMLGAFSLLIALLAPLAAELAGALPVSLLFTVAGLALLDVLAGALRDAMGGPLRLGPLVTFGVALVDGSVSLVGLGPYFWAIVLGVAASHLVERDGLAHVRPDPAPGQ